MESYGKVQNAYYFFLIKFPSIRLLTSLTVSLTVMESRTNILVANSFFLEARIVSGVEREEHFHRHIKLSPRLFPHLCSKVASLETVLLIVDWLVSF